MKTLFKLSLVCIAVAVGRPAFGQPTEWKEFVWKEGKVAILLPGVPTDMKNSIQVQMGTTLYMLNFTDIPNAKEATEETVNLVYDASRDAVVKQLKGKLLSDKKVMLDKQIGREVQAEVPNLGIYRTRIFQVGPRLYQLILIAPQAVAQGKEADRFFESFRLVK